MMIKNRTEGIIMRKKYYALLLSGFLIGCAPAKHTEISIPKSLADYSNQVSLMHQNIPIQELDMNVYKQETVNLQEYYDAFTYMEENSQQCNPVRSISYDKAVRDVDALFRLMKVTYGNYESFGGDAVFLQAQEAIKQALQANESLPFEDFSTIIRSHLSFINDQHVRIDNKLLQEPITTYESERKDVFIKRNDRYYVHDKEIESIDQNSELATYLKPQIQKNGDMQYHLFYQSATNITKVHVQFRDGSSEDIPCIASSKFIKQEEIIDTDDKAGIPYVHLNSMVYTKQDEAGTSVADTFYEAAKTFKNSKVAILDLRGNTGGNMFLVEEWCQQFLGKRVQGKASSLMRLPMEDSTCIARSKNFSQDIKEFQSLSLTKLNDLTYLYPKPTSKVANDTLLFVLQDANTISAAEHLIDKLHAVDNVIFVGTPTKGAISGSSFMRIFLKESGLEVTLGNMRTSFDESYASEYYGITPDSWVSSEDALDYVIGLVDVSDK